jgi:hypothetical protein
MKHVLALALLVGIVGCGPPGEDDVVGDWKGEVTFARELKLPDVTYTLSLKEDKTFTFTNSSGDDRDGTWEFSEGQVLLTYGVVADPMRPAVAGKQTLILGRDGKTMSYENNDNPSKPNFVKAN